MLWVIAALIVVGKVCSGEQSMGSGNSTVPSLQSLSYAPYYSLCDGSSLLRVANYVRMT